MVKRLEGFYQRYTGAIQTDLFKQLQKEPKKSIIVILMLFYRSGRIIRESEGTANWF